MDQRERREAIILTGSLIDQMRRKLAELENRMDLLLAGTVYRDDEFGRLMQRATEATTAPSAPAPSTPAPSLPTKRKSKYPEGPPLNRKVLEYLRKAKRPCGYQDVFEEIEAHHQSIQNSLRDLEKRGYAMKLGPNQWIATDQTRGGLTVM